MRKLNEIIETSGAERVREKKEDTCTSFVPLEPFHKKMHRVCRRCGRHLKWHKRGSK